MAKLTGAPGVLSALFGGGVAGAFGFALGAYTWSSACGDPDRTGLNAALNAFQRRCPVVGTVDRQQWALVVAFVAGFLALAGTFLLKAGKAMVTPPEQPPA